MEILYRATLGILIFEIASWVWVGVILNGDFIQSYIRYTISDVIPLKMGDTVIWKIFTVELFSFCAIINEIKLHEFFSTTDN